MRFCEHPIWGIEYGRNTKARTLTRRTCMVLVEPAMGVLFSTCCRRPCLRPLFFRRFLFVFFRCISFITLKTRFLPDDFGKHNAEFIEYQ